MKDRIRINEITLSFFALSWLFLFAAPNPVFTQRTVIAAQTSQKPFPPGLLIKSDNAQYINQNIHEYVKSWDMPLTDEILKILGIVRSSDINSSGTVQYITQVITKPTSILQGNSPITFIGTLNNKVVIQIAEPTQGRTITIPDASGEVSILGQTISGSEIENNTIDLVAKTTGNFVKSVSSGSGISLSGTEGQSWAPTISLGNLSGNWVQSGPYSIILGNSSSRIKMVDSSGSHYATFDVGSLSSDITYTLAGSAGTLLTSGNYSSYISGFLQASNNLSDISTASTSRSNLGLGTVAVQNATSIALTGGTINGASIGATTTATGAFTTLSSTGDTSLASAGNAAIGNSSGTVAIISTGLNATTAGVVSGITGYTQSSGNFAISGTGTLSTGTGAISLNGTTTVASGKTLAVTTADNLTVGGIIVPQYVTIAVPIGLALADQTVFVADSTYKLTAVRCVYSVKALSNGTLQVTVDTGTGAPGSGTAQLSSTLDLSETVNSVISGTLISSPTSISAGDRIGFDFSGTLTNLLGTCTLTLKRV